MANENANLQDKKNLGISGHENRNGNDGTITRFGWKAQNKSLLLFAGEAYNVEMGISNDIFPNEREEDPSCYYNGTPEDHSDPTATAPTDALSDITDFAHFMRFSAPAQAVALNPSTTNGSGVFKRIGCAYCHTPQMTTGYAETAALKNQPVKLFSDLLVHHMGPALADQIIQGNAGVDEFRSSPLWGLGQRIFFLHDGRTKDLVEAIQLHASTMDDRHNCVDAHSGLSVPLDKVACESEANRVVDNYNRLTTADKQDLLNFLRSL